MGLNDPAALLTAWTLGVVGSVAPTEPDHNNRSWVVEAEVGKYVLRLYDNLEEEAIRFEHALLTHLGSADLPFAVPTPVTTSAGGTLHVSTHDGVSTRAALFPFLPGSHPSRDDPVAAEALGATLACLHPALRSAQQVVGEGVLGGYGDVRSIHSLIGDPFAVGELLTLDPAPARQLRRAIERAFEIADTLYSQLPRQLIHSDYGTFNVLMLDGRVSAVIDFEFSTSDVRAMDFASAVRNVGHAAFFEGAAFDLPERFMRAYAATSPPTDEELTALPELIRLAVSVILIHWVGRWRQGITERSTLDGTINWVLTIDKSLDQRGAELVATLRRAAAL